MDTHIQTLFLCFIPLGIWRKVSGPSLLYTQASLHLSTLFPSQVFMLSFCFLVSLVPSLLFSSTLFDLLSPLLISLSLLLHASLSSSPRLLYLPFPPPSFGVCLSPSTPPLPSSFLLSSSLSLCLTRLPLILPASLALCSPHSATINYAQTQCTSLCSPPPDNSIHFSRALHSEWWMHWLCN